MSPTFFFSFKNIDEPFNKIKSILFVDIIYVTKTRSHPNQLLADETFKNSKRSLRHKRPNNLQNKTKIAFLVDQKHTRPNIIW